MLVLALSFSKVSFLFCLIRSSFIANAHQEKKTEALAKVFFVNGRLYPTIKARYPNDDTFIALLTMEMIKKGRPVKLKGGFGLMLPTVLGRFPENVFLDSLGVYGKDSRAKDWENFDFLFFRVLRSREFNKISRETLMKSISDQKISSKILFPLVLYLSWMKNYSLAEELRDWGSKENKLDQESDGFLKDDLLLRKNADKCPAEYSSIDKRLIENTVRRFLNDRRIKINYATNPVTDGSFIDRDSLKKYWTFSDMSDSEVWNKGSFYGDLDSATGKSLRVMGFFTKPFANKEESRAGFWYTQEIPLARKVYLFCFRYKTFQITEMPSFWLSYAFGKEWRLEPTDFKWREVYYIFDNRQYKIPKIQPLLRMWATGSVWFDDIHLLEIESEGKRIEKEILFIK